MPSLNHVEQEDITVLDFDVYCSYCGFEFGKLAGLPAVCFPSKEEGVVELVRCDAVFVDIAEVQLFAFFVNDAWKVFVSIAEPGEGHPEGVYFYRMSRFFPVLSN